MIRSAHIVSTRKLTSHEDAELQAAGWTLTCYDFISKVIDIPSDLNQQSVHKHVVFTSKMGVKAFLQIAEQLHLDCTNYTVYCISHRTRECALASGLNIKASAPNASALADEILRDEKVNAVTHVCSHRRRNELSEKLNKAGVAVQDVMAYRTEFTPVVVDQSYDAILFFSPSAVDSFLTLNPVQQVPCFCIGQTTAAHARQRGYKYINISDAPAEEALWQTIVTHFSITPPHAKE